MAIRHEHIALEDVQNLQLRSFNQVYIIDLNKSYLTTQDQQIDDHIPKEDIIEFLPIQFNSAKPEQLISRFDMIVNVLLQQQLTKNPVLRQLNIFGIKGKTLIELYQTQNFQKDSIGFKQIKQIIMDNITNEKGDVGCALLQYLQVILGIIKSGAENKSIGSCLEVFFFMSGSEISSDTEYKCLDELGKLKLRTDKVSISYRISDYQTSQKSIRKILNLSFKDVYSEDIGQLQFISQLEIEYIVSLLDIIQSKKINMYEQTARQLKSHHEECLIKLDSIQKQNIMNSKICSEIITELPVDDSKTQERRNIVQENIQTLNEVNESLSQMSIVHPQESMQQILYRKKMILQLIHCGVSLEDEKNLYQHKAQSLIFEKHELAKQFSDYLYDLKQVVDSKLEIFSGQLLIHDINVNTGFLFDYIKQDLQYTKKIIETSKEINQKIFILKKNVEKCNQKDLTEYIDQQLKQIQSVQFKGLRNIENSVIRVFICLQQILDSINMKDIKLNQKKKNVFDELTNLLRTNSDYQTYLPSNCEGTNLGKSFKVIIETYFKEFLK